MSSFYVQPNKIENLSHIIGNCSSILENYIDAVDSVETKLRGIPSLHVGESIKNVSARMAEEKESLQSMRDHLARVSVKYKNSENVSKGHRGFFPNALSDYIRNIVSFISDEAYKDYLKNSPISILSILFPASTLLGGSITNNYHKSDYKEKGFFEGKTDIKKYYDKDKTYTGRIEQAAARTGKRISDFNHNHEIKSVKKKMVDGKTVLLEKNHNKIIDDKEGQKEFDKLTKNDLLDSTEVTIQSWGWETENSLWRAEGIVGDKEGTHASGQVRLMNLDADATAYIGVASMGASAGVSISAFHADGEVQAGDKWFGVYAKGDVDALKAELKADASIGLLDQDGKVNPNLHLGGSAEAVLVEASGKVGTKIAGTDIGLKGGVNIGVGAHADIGLKDGKFTADLGASVGIGVSLKLEVDVSGTVDAVSGAAKSAMDSVGDIANGAGKMITNIGYNVGKGASNTLKGIGKGVGKIFGL